MNFIKILVFFALANIVQAQKHNEDLLKPENYFVIEGDTILRSSIELKEVIVFQPLKFYSYQEAKRYVILRERTYKVYPYAKLAADRLNVLTERLGNITSKRKRRIYYLLISFRLKNIMKIC